MQDSEIPRFSEWIHKEYDDVFLEGLPLGLLPTQKVEHSILLIGDLPLLKLGNEPSQAKLKVCSARLADL